MLAALHNESKAFQMRSPFNGEEEVLIYANLQKNFVKSETNHCYKSSNQRFVQHFDLLQKAHVPDHVSYYLFKESTVHARISVSV